MKQNIRNLIIEYISNEEIIAYHGSYENFDYFKSSKIRGGDSLFLGWGAYFTNTKKEAIKYGNIIYKVALFRNKKQYVLMDGNKPLDEKLMYSILMELYRKFKKQPISFEEFKSIANNNKKYNEIYSLLYNKLKEVDDDLKTLTPSEILNDNNKEHWFHISNYLQYPQIKDLYNKLLKLSNTPKLEIDLDINGSGNIIYNRISSILGGNYERASKFLMDCGVDGIVNKYSTGETNYSIFNMDVIEIIDKEYEKQY